MVVIDFLPDELFVKLHHVGHGSVVAHMAYDALEACHDVVTERHLGIKKYKVCTKKYFTISTWISLKSLPTSSSSPFSVMCITVLKILSRYSLIMDI